MAVPTYDELLAKRRVTTSAMEQTFNKDDLQKFSLELDRWEKLARFIGIPNPEIENIKSQGDMDEQKIKMLVCWKQRRGSMATYEAMARALLQIGRTDLAEEVISFRRLVSFTQHDTEDTQTDIRTDPSNEPIQATPPSPGSSSRIGEMSPDPQTPAVLSPFTVISNPTVHTAQQEVVISHLRELEEEFYELVRFTEDTLTQKDNEEKYLKKISRRFRMLPQSIRRQLQTDENYVATRQRILSSKEIKELFDNLTALKHWSYMMPDTLAHIVQDIKIDDMQQKIDKYRKKLTDFKTKTELKDMIGLRFPVPDYCIELTMEVVGWENKTVDEAEVATLNILRKAAYSGRIGMKAVIPGSTKMVFIFLEPTTNINIDGFIEACKESGVICIRIDEEEVYKSDTICDSTIGDEIVLSSDLWHKIGVGGGRDVLIIHYNPSSHPEAVPRQSSKLTAEGKQTLQHQGVSPDCQDELAIVTARYGLDKRFKIVAVKSGKVSRDEVMEYIRYLLTTTKNDGVVLHYIGAGRRGTGDWCFEDGFITFRDIAQLYLRASHNFKGRVLTITSDCSYSGCWVRDCMEFLDEQEVQPCGHKAREKGILIQVFASCRSNEVPTEYSHSVSGSKNDKNTGIYFHIGGKLSETQKTISVSSSRLHCKHKNIDEQCTLQPGYTWRKFNAKLTLVHGKVLGEPAWHYVLLDDNEEVQKKFRDKVASGGVVDVADYGQVLKSGWGRDPPNEVRHEVDKEYFLFENC